MIEIVGKSFYIRNPSNCGLVFLLNTDWAYSTAWFCRKVSEQELQRRRADPVLCGLIPAEYGGGVSLENIDLLMYSDAITIL